ncbi:GGDEF domain-containing protein [Entomohabitans teleogrylli]|uniref:sensor domain-containing diguanylate cyclase n=1 Tax=Entomohabitans teleogrylli TaxID=1384589 RepID=UPI00073D2510|nr:sensor domain-containing diguanylate cyclase [Entomohabitans teleogrylli]
MSGNTVKSFIWRFVLLFIIGAGYVFVINACSDYFASIQYQFSSLFYPAVILVLFMLHMIIACFMLINYLCNRRSVWLLVLSLTFLSSVFYLGEGLVIVERFFIRQILLPTRFNDLTIFYVFRQLSIAMMMAFAVSLEVGKKRTPRINREGVCITGMVLLCIALVVLAHMFSSYSDLLSLSLVDDRTQMLQPLWQGFVGWGLIALWGGVTLYISWRTRLKDAFWFSMAMLSVSYIAGLFLLVTTERIESLVWYFARIAEVPVTFAVFIVLLCEVFRMYQDSRYKYAQVYENSIRDPLTRIFNRGYFYGALKETLDDARHQYPVSVILGDIDYFKRINDRYGHQEGDSVICFCAAMLQQSLRQQDVVARVGGEEFALFLPHTSAQEAWAIAERIRQRIQSCSHPGSAHHLPEEITISFGLYTATQKSISADDCVNLADKAMYQAKQQGRNRTVIYHEPDPASA